MTDVTLFVRPENQPLSRNPKPLEKGWREGEIIDCKSFRPLARSYNLKNMSMLHVIGIPGSFLDCHTMFTHSHVALDTFDDPLTMTNYGKRRWVLQLVLMSEGQRNTFTQGGALLCTWVELKSWVKRREIRSATGIDRHIKDTDITRAAEMAGR